MSREQRYDRAIEAAFGVPAVKQRKALTRAYGEEIGLPDLLAKVGNVRVARLLHGNIRGCSICFPHGKETDNSTRSKNRRCWKFHRGTKYRPVDI